MPVPADHNRYLPTSIPAFSFNEPDRWKACCPSLEICAHADSEEEAIGELNMAVSRFLRNALEQGTLELDLLRRGWTLVCGSYLPPMTSRRSSCRLPDGRNQRSIIPIPVLQAIS